MSRYEIVKATRAHAEELALTMRHADVVELDALGYTPLAALIISVDDSTEAWAGLADGKVIAIFGHTCRSLLSDEAFPWLLTAQDMPHHAKAFLKLNRQYMTEMRKRFRLLWGSVCVTNTISIRWLRWLGFTIDEAVTYPTPGKPGFRYFHLEN